MQPRQIVTTISGVACTGGIAAAIPSLNPAWAAYQLPLLVLGGSAIAGGIFGFVYLLATAPKPAPAREFLPSDITPHDLTQKVVGLMGVHAEAIGQLYHGKWMRVSGVVNDVVPINALSRMLGIYEEVDKVYVVINFERKWVDQLAALNKGDSVTVIGQLFSVGAFGINLKDGEIEQFIRSKPTLED